MKYVDTDSETLQWFPTPMRWSSEGEREEWAELCALAVLHAHEEKPKRRRVKALRGFLASYVADFSKLTPADQAFLFVPVPDQMPVPAFLLMAESEGDRDTTLRQIIQADAESLIRPVEVESFPTERLGEGLRSTRYWSTADGQLMATVRYGWRVDEVGIDLCFYMVWNDPGRMAAYADAVDDFAKSLWISDTR
ncbi:hypothetical protein ACFYQT_31795 [Streptomyces tibetensis]|uniref:DUF1795 domain-containing protein n=1 Tax=Streptomyces tibetensis TaxID=2382123 RepID=A0ABW6N3Y6_9ACTN